MYKIGLIAGSFDVIHPGYIRMFKESKNICSHLIVALQDDPTIDRPEKCKPVQSISDRIEILESIKYIDKIIVYNTEEDLLNLLKETDFEVRILGSDYIGKNFTGDNMGKPTEFINRNHKYSTTDLKQRISESLSNKMVKN